MHTILDESLSAKKDSLSMCYVGNHISSKASYSGSSLFTKRGHILVQQDRG